MSDPRSTDDRQPHEKPGCIGCWGLFAILVMVVLLSAVALGPMGHGRGFRYVGPRIQQARVIGLAMFSYANDHGGQYPDGKSSTEIFQQLLDENDVCDPTVFYLSGAGKREPVAGQKLKPENVSFDITAGADLHSPDTLPLVFSTGFRVNYAPGTAAVPLGNTGPAWWEGFFASDEDAPVYGIAVFYKGNVAKFVKPIPKTNPDGSVTYPPEFNPTVPIPDFISPDFKPDGKTYRQLTPDGVKSHGAM